MEFSIGDYVPVTKISCMYNVPKILFGSNAVETLAEEILNIQKNPKIFLISDKGVEKAGITDKVITILEKSNLDVEVFSELEGEPTIQSMKKPVEIVRDESFAERTVIIGLGGGSVIDTAKVTSILATNPGEPSDLFIYPEEPSVENPPVPKILLSTTAGTGSEVTWFAVAIEENGLKNFFTSPYALAEAAIIDPILHISCPPKITAECGMDALAHAVESILTRYTVLSDAFAFHAIKLIANNLRRATFDGMNIEARHNMALAAALGGLSIVITPANIGHCLSEVIGPKYKISHGLANAIVTPYQMEYNIPACIERLNLIAKCFDINIHGISKREAAKKAVEAVKDLLRDLDIPTCLKEIGVPKEDLPNLAKMIIDDRQKLYDLDTWNPRKLTLNNVTELLERMWNGY